LVSPFPSLCGPSVSHELLAWTTALSMRDGRWSSARGSQTPRERPSPEGAETPASGQGGSVARPTMPRDRAWPDRTGGSRHDHLSSSAIPQYLPDLLQRRTTEKEG